MTMGCGDYIPPKIPRIESKSDFYFLSYLLIKVPPHLYLIAAKLLDLYPKAAKNGNSPLLVTLPPKIKPEDRLIPQVASFSVG